MAKVCFYKHTFKERVKFAYGEERKSISKKDYYIDNWANWLEGVTVYIDGKALNGGGVLSILELSVGRHVLSLKGKALVNHFDGSVIVDSWEYDKKGTPAVKFIYDKDAYEYNSPTRLVQPLLKYIEIDTTREFDVKEGNNYFFICAKHHYTYYPFKIVNHFDKNDYFYVYNSLYEYCDNIEYSLEEKTAAETKAMVEDMWIQPQVGKEFEAHPELKEALEGVLTPNARLLTEQQIKDIESQELAKRLQQRSSKTKKKRGRGGSGSGKAFFAKLKDMLSVKSGRLSLSSKLLITILVLLSYAAALGLGTVITSAITGSYITGTWNALLFVADGIMVAVFTVISLIKIWVRSRYSWLFLLITALPVLGLAILATAI